MFRNPFRQHRIRPVRWVATAAAALVLTAAAQAVASPAYAEPWPIADSFENDPYSRWTVSAVPGLTSVSMGAHTVRGRTGPNLAYLHAYPDSPSTATVFRTITPDSATPRPYECGATVYLARVANAGEQPGDTVNLFLRIRQGGPTGPIISNKGVTILPTSAWEGHTFNERIPWPTSTITVEISAYRGSAYADDLTFRCYDL